jgi:hypothetical protein
MLLDKNDLLKLLRSLVNFDTNASPYIAVQLVEDDFPRFYRSSSFGQIQSSDFNLQKSGNTYVSLSHFQDCLRVLAEEKVELSLDPNGILKITSTDNSFDSEIRVHTVPVTQAGLKSHDLGIVTTRLDSTTFLGCDTSPFVAAAPPILSEGRLLIITKYGAIMWDGPETLKKVPFWPRESFMKLVSGNPQVDDLILTDKGYWGVRIQGMNIMSHGHLIGRELFNVYNVPGVELARFPAQRLVYALGAAAGLCEEQDRIEIVPKEGIVTHDRFGSVSKFSLGGVEGWSRFATFGRTVKTIADALIQVKDDEEVVLFDVPSFSNPTKRFRRGQFEISFRTV